MLPNIVVLTGAGISAESGLKTFRDNDGLWENHSVEEVATPEAFALNPALVYRFYNERRSQLQSEEVDCNDGHRALARLQNLWGSHFTLVTQNVDDLHERAGSQGVLHMHGELLSARCRVTDQRFSYTQSFDHTSVCNCCQQAGNLRPDIVWFGEIPMYMDDILLKLTQADIFIAIGTSGQVYPAANFVQVAKDYGATTINVNLNPEDTSWLFDENYFGPAGIEVPKLVAQLMQEYSA